MFDPTVPVPDRDSAPYWSALADGRFEIQHCLDCDGWSWPPVPIYAHCQSDNLEWKAPSGKGEIHSWVRLHRPIFPALKDLVPFKIVDVRLDEAPNLLIQVGCSVTPTSSRAHGCGRCRSRRPTRSASCSGSSTSRPEISHLRGPVVMY